VNTTESRYETFQETCAALGVPPGSGRVDAFLKLPEPTQNAIWRELEAHLQASARQED
jgi:hypothetical protein